MNIYIYTYISLPLSRSLCVMCIHSWQRAARHEPSWRESVLNCGFQAFNERGYAPSMGIKGALTTKPLCVTFQASFNCFNRRGRFCKYVALSLNFPMLCIYWDDHLRSSKHVAIFASLTWISVPFSTNDTHRKVHHLPQFGGTWWLKPQVNWFNQHL